MSGKPFVKMTVRWTGGPSRVLKVARAPATKLVPVPVNASRPAKGVAPNAALELWSDPVAFAAAKELEFTKYGGQPSPAGEALEPNRRYPEYLRRRDVIEHALLARLEAGTLVASGIERGASRREVIDRTLFATVWVDYDEDEIGGGSGGWEFLSAEIFEPSAIPLNIREIPEWLAPEFTHTDDYHHVVLRGVSFSFGGFQAKAVAMLHAAALTNSPWLVGKKLLGDVGSKSTKMSDLFKSNPNWRELIETGKLGRYRLRLG